MDTALSTLPLGVRYGVVLVVDDEPNIALSLEYRLAQNGYRVETAHSGEEALIAAAHRQPDLILLDVMMPGIDGVEACRRLKSDSSTRDIPVIFMTGLSGGDTRVAFEAGGVDYITKPFHFPEVLARVNAHLSIRVMQRERAALKSLLHTETEARQRDEERLRQTLREADAIMKNASVAIYFTRGRRLVRYNKKCAEMFGIEGDTALGAPASRFYRSEEEYEALGRSAEPLLAQGKPFQTEMYLRRLDGRQMWVNLIAYVENPDNTSQGTIWICEDRTQKKDAEEQLKLARDELNAIVENASIAVVFTRNQRIQHCNCRAAEMFGAAGPAALIGRPSIDLYPDEESYARLGQAASPLLAAGKSFQADWQFRKLDDSPVWCKVYAKAVDPLHTDQGTVWILEDISEARKTQEALHRTLHEREAILQNAPVGVLFTRDRRIVRYNPKWAEMFGFQGESHVGLPARVHFRTDEEYDAVGRAAAPLLSRGRPYQTELYLRREDGTEFWGNIIAYVQNPQDTSEGTIWICEDRTAFKQSEQHIHRLNAELEQRVSQRTAELMRTNAELQQVIAERKRVEYQAQHDPLTGLANRLLFEHDFTHAIAHARRNHQRVALLFLDLDGFKPVNDSLGHEVGDRLLQSVARRLQGCLREEDDVARLGGDEFVICLPELKHDNDAMLVAGKVLTALRRPFVVGGHEIHIGCSIGISLYPTDGDDIETLLRAADAAMYRAKQNGRNNYQFFTASLNASARNRQMVAQRLRHAFEREEFTLHYQPQIDLATGRIAAIEALLRWRPADTGTGGVLPASEFIRVAEDTGLITPLGEWVLRQACEQLRRRRVDGNTDLRLAINLSPQQLRRAELPNLLAEILRDNQLPPAALDIEIAEASALTEDKDSARVLSRLTQMGLRLVIDDFGSGLSAPVWRHRFPVGALKIDRPLVNGIGHNVRDARVVTAIIAMASSLDVKVIAEGVETAEQAAFLRARGCAAAQGHHFSAAVAAEKLDNLLGDTARACALRWREAV